MNSSRLIPTRYGREIEYKIPNLSQENICRNPIEILGIVWIPVYETKASEVCGCLQYGTVTWVADELREIVVDDRGRDEVRPGGKVNYS